MGRKKEQLQTYPQSGKFFSASPQCSIQLPLWQGTRFDSMQVIEKSNKKRLFHSAEACLLLLPNKNRKDRNNYQAQNFARFAWHVITLCFFNLPRSASELAHTVVHAVIKFHKKLIHIKIDSYKCSIYKRLKTFYNDLIANTACGKDQQKKTSIHKKIPMRQVVHFSGTAASVHDPHGCGLSKCLKSLV